MPMNMQKERLCELLLIGRSSLDAYCEVYGMKEGETRESNSLKDRARYASQDEEVVSRVRSLRAPVVKEAQAQLGFSVAQAMQKIDHVHGLAEALGEPSVMLKAIELQAKLHKLLVDVKEVRRDLLDDQSTQDLVLLLGELKRRRSVDCVVEGGAAVVEGAVVSRSVDLSRLI